MTQRASGRARPGAYCSAAVRVTNETVSRNTTASPAADDVWLRAIMLAPDLQNYLSATLFNPPDPKELRPLMQKPGVALTLTFADDPMDGMVTDHFSGDAVVFLDTVSFVTRTAALQ